MYQVLARKYRPRNFNELVGQNHVSRALTSALDRGRLHHAYLFTGTRGVGKTTIARILAKCLNCETGVTSTPCETCATCRAVNDGRFIDLIEIDAASRTKVEDTRELLDNVPYAPTQGRFKVYLIDEVHMLSTHSFNALLKTLEEPPSHVKFLFATTDPQKLPITVISRCLQFTLRPLAVDEITQHLTQILKTEAIEADHDALWQISEAAQGSVRDALSLTDQAIAFGQGEIHHQDVKDMLGLIDRTIIYDLIAAIHQNQQRQVSQLLLQFRQQALDAALVLDQLISTLHELAMMQYLPELSLNYSAEINQKIQQLAGSVSAQDIQLYYQIACRGRADLQMAVTQEQGFEMTVLRLLAFRPLALNEMLTVASAPSPVVQAQAEIVTNTDHQQALAPVTTPNTTQVTEQVITQATEQAIATPNTTLVTEQALTQTTEQTAAPITTEAKPAVEPVAVSTFVQSETAAQPSVQSQQENLLDELPALSTFAAHETISAAAPSTLNIAALPDQDAFFLDPTADDSSQTQSIEVVGHSTVVEPVIAESVVVESVVIEPVFAEADITEADSVEVEPDSVESVALSHPSMLAVSQVETLERDQLQQAVEVKPTMVALPQDILTLEPQQLEGDWDINKWEYWFRSSALPPAVQELAQQGLMTGQINGASVFHISPQYENLLANAQLDLQNVLIKQWPQTRFSLDYEDIAATTPFMLQQQRKQQASQCALNLLQKEPIIEKLMLVFDAQLHNIQVK